MFILYSSYTHRILIVYLKLPENYTWGLTEATEKVAAKIAL